MTPHRDRSLVDDSYALFARSQVKPNRKPARSQPSHGGGGRCQILPARMRTMPTANISMRQQGASTHDPKRTICTFLRKANSATTARKQKTIAAKATTRHTVVLVVRTTYWFTHTHARTHTHAHTRPPVRHSTAQQHGCHCEALNSGGLLQTVPERRITRINSRQTNPVRDL